MQGEKGDRGDNGNGISSIDYYYATTGTQTTPDASSVTSTTIPTMSPNNKYLWQKEVIHFTDSGAADKVTVALIGVYGDDGTGRETIAMTSPSTPNGTYVNQLGAYKGQIYQWNGTVWVKQGSGVYDLTEGVYLHFSFENLSLIPQNTSTRYTKSSWTSSDYWTKGNENFTQTIVNNKLRLTCTNDCNMKITKSINVRGNDLFYIRFKAYGEIDALRIYDENNCKLDVDFEKYKDVACCCLLGTAWSTRTFGIDFHEAEAGAYVDIEIVQIFSYSFASSQTLDNSGNNRKATDNNRNLVVEDIQHGKCIQEFGVSHIQLPKINDVGKTYCIWFNCTDYTSRRTIFCEYYDGFIIEVNTNGYLRFYYYGSNGGWQNVKTISVNTWYHIAVSVTNNQVIFYLNGEKLKTISHSQISHNHDNFIGALSSSDTNSFVGLLDEFVIYDRNLSDEEVYALYLKNGKLEQIYSYEDYLADQKANLVFSKNPIALNKRRDNKSMYSNYSCYIYMSLVRANNELYPLDIADVVLDRTDLPSYCSLSKTASDDSNYSVKLTLTFNAYSSGEAVREATNFRIGLTVNGQNGVTYYNYIDVVYNQYGKYVGAIKAIDNGTGGTRTVTMLDDTTKTISEGDYFVWAGTTDDGNPFYISHLYQFMATNSSTYVCSEYATDEDVATALGDIGSVIDRATVPNNKGMTYIKNLVSNNAFINNLFAENITMNDTGIIKSENYNSNVNAYNIRGYWEYIGRSNTTNLHIVVNFPESYTGDIEVQIWKKIEGEGGLVKQDTRYMSNYFSHWIYNMNIPNLDPNTYVYKIDVIEPHLSTFFYITRNLLERNPNYEFMNTNLNFNGFKIQSNGDASFYGNTLLKGYSFINNAILQDSLLVLNGSKTNYTIEFSGDYQTNTYNDLFPQLSKLNNLLLKYSRLWKNLNSTFCYGLTNLVGYFNYNDIDNNKHYSIYFNTSLAEINLNGTKSELTNNNLVFDCECVNYYIQEGSNTPKSLPGTLTISIYFGGTTSITINTKLDAYYFLLYHGKDIQFEINANYTGYIRFAI